MYIKDKMWQESPMLAWLVKRDSRVSSPINLKDIDHDEKETPWRKRVAFVAFSSTSVAPLAQYSQQYTLGMMW
jgi:hypothetical protein